jgi:hypothetical protein
MLVAAATLNGFCAPTLSALKQAGLEYLLFDEAQAQAIRNAGRDATHRTALPEASPATKAPRGPTKNMREASRPALPEGRPPVAGAPAARRTQGPAQDTRETSWPAVWQERLQKTKAAPIICTYWELGLDLCGAPDSKRRELFQALLRDLAYPPGTLSFWPLALPAQDGKEDLEANAPVFWEGVKLLHGRAAVIMGSQALRALALPGRMPALRPFQQARHQGIQLIVLHSPDALMQEPRRMETLPEFLRQALAPFV